MNYDHPKQSIDGSFTPLADTLWEARERQRLMDMQRRADMPYSLFSETQRQRDMQQFGYNPITGYPTLFPTAQDFIAWQARAEMEDKLRDMETKVKEAESKAQADFISKTEKEIKQLSNRQLLEEIYIMLKTR